MMTDGAEECQLTVLIDIVAPFTLEGVTIQ